MSQKLKRKTLIMLLIEFVCLIALGIFLFAMQTNLSERNQRESLKQKMQQVGEVVRNAEENEKERTASYDRTYTAKATSAAYMVKKDAPDYATPSNASLKQYRDVLAVDNVLVLDRAGKVIARAETSPADFTRARYNQLRTVFSEEGPSEPFEVVTDGVNRRYYGAKIDSQRMAVIETAPEDLDQILEETSTWKSILDDVSVGLAGYSFAVSAKDYTFLYHPDPMLVGEDALDAGISAVDLEDDNYTWLTVDGERLYCGIARYDDAYIICAVTEEEINSSRGITVGIVLFTFFIVITLVVAYAVLTLLHEEQGSGEDRSHYVPLGKRWLCNKDVAKRICTISFIGLLFVFVISFYMQTLFAMSQQSMSSTQRVGEVEQTIGKAEKNIEVLTEQYDGNFLSKGRTAAFFLTKHPELINRDDLAAFSEALDVEFICMFDKTGYMYATDSNYTNFTLSEDPENQSYGLRPLLMGVEYVIQKAQIDDVGEFRQYIGVSMKTETGEGNGFAEIAVKPEMLEEAVTSLDLAGVLKGIRVGTNGFAFAVNKADNTFLYYPEEKYIGRSAVEYGMTENQLRDGYCDYIKLGSTRYYGSSLETDDAFVYVVVPERELEGERGEISLASAGVSLLCLVIVCLLFSLSKRELPKPDGEDAAGAEADGNGNGGGSGNIGSRGLAEVRGGGKQNGEEKTLEKEALAEADGGFFNIKLSDGKVLRTQSASDRLSNITVKFMEKSPEQQVISILKGLLGVLAFGICLAVLFKNTFFDESSVFYYVLEGKWERGLNVFAVTGSIMVICVVSVGTMVVRKLLKILSNILDARGETICRLLSSFIKYVSAIAQLYFCFAMFGVDTKTLLASAGILTLVVGLGAQTLVSDILAGLFIIFEGEFRVGDIVTIGDWRGTVREIGVRTTKIEDGSKNIKIFSNSAVTGVINMTKQYSFATCDVGIEYGESIERVENILEKEFPNIRRRLPAIKDGPFYKGVVMLGDNSVNIRILSLCDENDRIQLERDMNREMKILFDKYDINIPFPQVVLHEPTVFKEATAYEKYKADEFNKEQKDLTKNLWELSNNN